MQILWLKSAELDVKEVISYYEQISEQITKKIILHIIESVYKLADFPEVGIASEQDSSLRKLIVTKYNYIIVYKIEEGYVKVVQVFDTRQDPDKLKYNY